MRRIKPAIARAGMLVIAVLVSGCASAPPFAKEGVASQRDACIINMRVIESAKDQWALTERKVNGDTVDVIRFNEYVNKDRPTPSCPSGGGYEYKRIGENPECSVHGTLREALRVAEDRAAARSAYASGSFWGKVLGGTPDYSDKAFERLEQVFAKGAPQSKEDGDLFEEALMGLMYPKGPLVGVRVVLCSGGDAPEARETTTDEEGSFHFDRLADGEYTLTVYKPRKWRWRPLKMSWRLKNDQLTGDELIFPSEFVAAKGKVVDSAGNPLAGIGITAEEFGYDFESQRWSPVAHVVKAVTDSQGRYTLPGLHVPNLWRAAWRRGEYLVRAEGKEFAPRVQEIKVVTERTHAAMRRLWASFRKATPPDSDETEDMKLPTPADSHGVLAGVDFTMTAPATLGGCVRDSAGNPIPKTSVWLDAEGDVPSPPPPLHYRKVAYADERGRFSFGDLLPGHYSLGVSVAEYVKQEIAREMTEGQTVDLPVKMERSGTAQVRVTRNGAVTVPDSIAAIPGCATKPIYWWPETTNADGLCEFSGLKPGPNYIRAEIREKDHIRYESISATIQAGQTNLVEITMDGECGFDLNVSFPKGGAARVWMDPADAPVVEGYWKDENLKAHLWADHPGQFAFEHLPAGEYRISLQYFESQKTGKGQPWKAGQVKAVRLAPDERPVITFEF